jgi:lipopolysaccharide/colanic/teichoic acid biosynthesis glycosyltransferase
MNSNHQGLFFQKELHFKKIDFNHSKGQVFDEDIGFYTEIFFNEMLATERKRTERSQKPILLVMLDIEKLFDELPRKNIINNISSVLADATREIDIKGWYKSQKSIGIIYTEFNMSGIDSIVHKLHGSLEVHFEQELAEKVLVSYATFPESAAQRGIDNIPVGDIRFYPSAFNYSRQKIAAHAAKRVLDIIGSSILMLFLSPLFIIIPLLIKLTSKGPVFFTQTRIGLGGRPFKFIKFRSMYVGNDPSVHRDFVKNLILGEQGGCCTESKTVYKIKNDSRVTPLGKFLRKSSLDELPQFFNVLSGDMSLVGPRPPIPYEMENYHSWHKRRVLEIKPGITGFWQVAGRSTTTFDTMVRMDLQYIMRWSLWWDIKLIIRTPLAVFKGAY